MKRHGRIAWLTTALVLTAVGFASPAPGEEPKKEGGRPIDREAKPGIYLHTMEMTLHPRAEPRLALRYRLIPDDFDMLDENAAVYYLKAMGFLEQSRARSQLVEVEREARRATAEGKRPNQVAPFSWLNMKPGDLPLEEVHEFLGLTAFQTRSLEEAARRRRFDMDRNIREVDNPLAYPLPECQLMRELARTQSLRSKVAIAEGRIDDAIAILGQQYAMARHLGQDEFLVSALVGSACAGIAWNDMLYLVQHPDAPNLYWALASIPRPLIDLRRPMSVERQLLFLHFKVLLEVDETPRPAGYWRDFLDRLIPQFGGLRSEFGLPEDTSDPEAARAALAGFVATAYPGAKRYLLEDLGMPAEKVEAYPTAQVVFLAMVRFNEEARDHIFKWHHLPYWQANSKLRGSQYEGDLWKRADRIGLSAMPTRMLLPAILGVRMASARIEQQLAMLQTVEAIRMHAASHAGKLPKTLDEMALPAPLDPLTGQPLDYRYQGDHAVLTGHEVPGRQYRLILRVAKKAK